MYTDIYVEITMAEALEIIKNKNLGISKYFNRKTCQVDEKSATEKKVIWESSGRCYIERYTILTVDGRLYLNRYAVDSSD
jgi:hypothetical protein